MPQALSCHGRTTAACTLSTGAAEFNSQRDVKRDCETARTLSETVHSIGASRRTTTSHAVTFRAHNNLFHDLITPRLTLLISFHRCSKVPSHTSKYTRCPEAASAGLCFIAVCGSCLQQPREDEVRPGYASALCAVSHDTVHCIWMWRANTANAQSSQIIWEL